MVAILDKAEGLSVVDILSRIAKEYPQVLLFLVLFLSSWWSVDDQFYARLFAIHSRQADLVSSLTTQL